AGVARKPNTSSLDGLDRTNCGPQVRIAAISFTTIRDHRIVDAGACRVRMSLKRATNRRGSGRVRTGGPQFRRGLAQQAGPPTRQPRWGALAASDAERERPQSRSYKKKGGP